MCYPTGVRPGISLTSAGLVAVALAIGLSAGSSSADPVATKPAPAKAAARPSGAEVQKSLDELNAAVEKLGGRLGASVVSVDDLGALGAVHADRAMNPASNAKIVTAAAALTLLGPQHRFFTGLYGKAEDGRVDELVLRGKGDPLLEMADLRQLGHQLAVAGVHEVGHILVDQSHFDGRFVPPAFEQQPNEWAPFRAPVSAVALDRNTVTLWIRPASEAGKPATLISDPPGFVEASGTIKTAKKSAPEKVGVTLSQKGDHLLAKVEGSLPQSDRPVPAIRRVDDPSAFAGYALRAVLREQGMKVGDEVKVGASSEKRALATHSSPALGEILPRLGKDSDNFVAEMVFLALGAKEKGADHATAASAVESFLRDKKVWEDGTVVKNGSGLFDSNRFTAHTLATLTAETASDPRSGPEFVAQFAIAGVDGTLRHRLDSWASRRAIRAKTGTLAQVIALSGVILDPQGRPALAFSFLCDGVGGKVGDARKALDRAADRLGDAVWRAN